MKAYTTEEWIEKYLDGNLNEQELREFHDKRKNDPDFDRLYSEQIKLRNEWKKAGQLHQTRIEVAGAIRKEKNRKKKILYTWAAAASILLIVSISGVIFWNGNPDIQPSVVHQSKERDTTIYQPISPQYLDAEEKASYGTADSLILLGPSQNQECQTSHFIVFRWKPAPNDSTKLVIKRMDNDTIIFEQKIGPGELHYIMKKGSLPVGEYAWHLQNEYNQAQFKVTTVKKDPQ